MAAYLYPYKDPTQPEQNRIQDLLSRMTLEEKFAQMRMIPQIDHLLEGRPFSAERVCDQLKYGIGASYSPDYIAPDILNAFQSYLLHDTRLGIPLIMMGESLHGVMSPEATVFPQAIGLGATFNAPLIAEMTGIIGREARTLGITQTYAPNLDLSRDPRWGRTEENYGEDPYLTATLGTAYVKALQEQGVASSPKHYVAHGSPEGGVNLSPVHCGERELRDTMLIPFAAAFQEGGALSVMPAYSEWDGTPIHASSFLMTDILRHELGFEGFAVSDFGAITMLHQFHKVASDALEAGKMALTAGLDMEAPNIFGFGQELMDAVRQGSVPLDLIDQAVGRILRVKFRLGLFENPYAQIDNLAGIRDQKAISLARTVAQESIVLLKNEFQLLPLSDQVGRVAVIGPNAALAQLGDYTHRVASRRAVSLLEGVRQRLGTEKVIFAPGCTIAFGQDSDLAEAVRAAEQSDVALVVLGDNSNFHGGIGWGDEEGGHVVTCGEGFDLSSLSLPGRQQELLEAVAATGTPVVLIMVSGRPYDLCWADHHIPAILQAWYPGEQGGAALCDIIFGSVSPSARLPISFPKSAGHIPCFYNHKVSARGYYKKPGSPEEPGRDYVFSSPDALYPFGYGLSYTTFSYSDLAISPAELAAPDQVTISATVKNTGSRPGKEVVQLYLTDCFSRITPFVRRLRGYSKILLQPGESCRVSFTLDQHDYSFINESMRPETEPGEFRVELGGLTGSFWIKNGV
ncbi:MAG: glycoside hydrolase family 3 N-terminal domain-containing protein [Clostridiaceae bacterium]|nr:glycoside hydrolase family 3 N-terminal domain-containing protein [Clostridiaceae bacterium]